MTNVTFRPVKNVTKQNQIYPIRMSQFVPSVEYFLHNRWAICRDSILK